VIGALSELLNDCDIQLPWLGDGRSTEGRDDSTLRGGWKCHAQHKHEDACYACGVIDDDDDCSSIAASGRVSDAEARFNFKFSQGATV
jgi:hypothetical protein